MKKDVDNKLDIYKLTTSEEEVRHLSEFMNRYQNEADHLTGKIS